MQLVCKVNHIETTTKYRLIDSGILSIDQNEEVSFLRLRFFYMNSAIFLHLANRTEEPTMHFKPDFICDLLKSADFVVPEKTLIETLSASPKRVAQIIKSMKISPLFIPADSLFYGLRGDFYKSKDMARVAEQLNFEAQYESKKPFSPANRNVKRCLTGLNIQHPKGQFGVEKSKKLFFSEVGKLINPPAPTQELSYDNLDYGKLNWRKVISHENFDKVFALVACPNNSYLRQFTGHDNPSMAVLATLSEQAAKHIRNPEIHVEEVKHQSKTSSGKPKFRDLEDLGNYMLNTEGAKISAFIYANMYNRVFENTHEQDIFAELDLHIAALSAVSENIGKRIRLEQGDVQSALGIKDDNPKGKEMYTRVSEFIFEFGLSGDRNKALAMGQFPLTGFDDGIFIWGAKDILLMFTMLKDYLKKPRKEKDGVTKIN